MKKIILAAIATVSGNLSLAMEANNKYFCPYENEGEKEYLYIEFEQVAAMSIAHLKISNGNGDITADFSLFNQAQFNINQYSYEEGGVEGAPYTFKDLVNNKVYDYCWLNSTVGPFPGIRVTN